MPETTATTILPGSLRKVVPNARLIGKSDPTKEINVSIYVRKNPNPPPETVLKAEEIAKQLPGQRDQLTDEEFNAVYGADSGDLKAAADWAKANSLQVLDESVSKRRLLVRGTINAIQKAFGTELNEFEHPQHGRFRGREGNLHVSNELVGVVTGVFGLDTRKVGHSRMRRIPGRSAPVEELLEAHKSGSKLTTKWPGTFFPPQVAQLYQYPQFDGTGQNVAVFAFNGSGARPTRGAATSCPR